MSKARRLRRTRQWARYFNRYGHVAYVSVGGTAAYREVFYSNPTWFYIRRQQKRTAVAR